MFSSGTASPSRAVLLLLALAACEEAEGVNVQPLPPLERPSAAARAGLPEVEGTWRFAGWELPVRDTVTEGAGMLPPGELAVKTQRLDSIAGAYVRDGQEYPFVGEVRRDGIVSLVAFGPDGSGSILAGHAVRDTLWIEFTTLAAAQTWSTGARAALVRTPVRQPFVRYQGGYVRPNLDSIAADSVARADSLRRADSLAALVPGTPGSVPEPVPAPPAARPSTPPATTPVEEAPRPRPQPQRETPPARRSEPQAEQEARRREAEEAARRRREEEAERRREEEAREPAPLPEPRPELEPLRPDTTRRPAPVIIP